MYLGLVTEDAGRIVVWVTDDPSQPRKKKDYREFKTPKALQEFVAEQRNAGTPVTFSQAVGSILNRVALV